MLETKYSAASSLYTINALRSCSEIAVSTHETQTSIFIISRNYLSDTIYTSHLSNFMYFGKFDPSSKYMHGFAVVPNTIDLMMFTEMIIPGDKIMMNWEVAPHPYDTQKCIEFLTLYCTSEKRETLSRGIIVARNEVGLNDEKNKIIRYRTPA